MTVKTPLPPRPLVVSGLTVARGERTLVAGLDLTLAPGSVLVLRGKNGAGKSSLLLTLAGILRPSAGQIDLGTGDERPGTALHFLGHRSGVKPRLTLAENLRFWCELLTDGLPRPPSGDLLPRKGDGLLVPDALATVGLDGLDDHDAGHLSQGQTRRLALARLVAIPRPLWLLDEPIESLDTGGEELVVRLIEGHRATGGIAVVATHHDLPLAAAQTLTLGAA